MTEILHARVLAVAIKSATGVDETERGKLLEQWERVTFRIFGLFGKDSRSKVGDYVRLAWKIVANDIDTRTYNEIMAGLRKLGADYPIDQALEEGLVNKNCYERPDECRYILWSYEEHLAQAGGGGTTVDEAAKARIWNVRAIDSIEHVFPKSGGNSWRHKMVRPGDSRSQQLEPNVGRIGNLLLLPLPLNQEVQNSSFGVKKENYARHNLRMIQEICAQQDWTLSEIEGREARIVAWAKTRWGDI